MTPEKRAILERLRRDARYLAERFGLPLRSLDAESPRVRRRYGICYDDGSIKIRLHNVRTGELLKYSFLVDTLCHELAHLRHFDHGPRFQAFYRRILGYARRNGIYAPTPRWAIARRTERGRPEVPQRAAPAREPRGPESDGPVQLELF